VFAALADDARLTLHCLYSRHHDGYVRQRNADQLLKSDQPYVAPFIVRLVGEYVIEIIDMIRARLDLAHGTRTGTMYNRFVAENQAFVSRTQHQAISYWNCYYRFEYPVRRPIAGSVWEPYPAFVVLDALRLA
jgi:hypothetical protein